VINIHALGGIRTRDPNNRAAADLRLSAVIGVGILVTILPISNMVVPKEKEDSVSACFVFIIYHAIITSI
jgi:hypothetical protein